MIAYSVPKQIAVNPLYILRAVFLCIAAALCVIALAQVIASARFLSVATRSFGTVVDFQSVEGVGPFLTLGRGEGEIFYPIVRFQTDQGAWRQFVASAGGYRRSYRINQMVPVLSRDMPEQAVIDNWQGVWGRGVIFGGLSTLFTMLGLLAPLGFGTLARKNQQRQS